MKFSPVTYTYRAVQKHYALLRRYMLRIHIMNNYNVRNANLQGYNNKNKSLYFQARECNTIKIHICSFIYSQ